MKRTFKVGLRMIAYSWGLAQSSVTSRRVLCGSGSRLKATSAFEKLRLGQGWAKAQSTSNLEASDDQILRFSTWTKRCGNDVIPCDSTRTGPWNIPNKRLVGPDPGRFQSGVKAGSNPDKSDLFSDGQKTRKMGKTGPSLFSNTTPLHNLTTCVLTYLRLSSDAIGQRDWYANAISFHWLMLADNTNQAEIRNHESQGLSDKSGLTTKPSTYWFLVIILEGPFLLASTS